MTALESHAEWKVIADELPRKGKFVILGTEKGRKAIGRLMLISNFSTELNWQLSIGKDKPIDYFFEWREI
jgi:hypothetical protein